jgi:tetratricopeptide (TPR) repeat protein
MLICPKTWFSSTLAWLSRWAICCVFAFGGVSTLAGSLIAQDDSLEIEEPELIDQAPFDLIVLKASAGGGSFKVAPLPFPNRQIPPRPADTKKLENVVLLKFETRRYEILWRDIERIDLYEQLIYDEALRKLQAKDFISAFMNLSFLLKNYPSMPNLEGLRRDFLLQSAATMYRANEYRQTLSALEELLRTAPDYQGDTVKRYLSRAADALINSYYSSGELSNAKLLHQRLKSLYGSELEVVQVWDKKLDAMAMEKRDEAIRLIEEKKYRSARAAAISMLDILPDAPEAKQLVQQINKLHPMVRVGVMQKSAELDPTSLVNWPARRAGALVYQSLIQFLKTGSEGGRYGFALGTFRQSDDRQELILSLDPSIGASLNAYGLTQVLLDHADPQRAEYDPSWAAVFQSAVPNNATQVTVRLKRPNVLPHALMQWIIPKSSVLGALPGSYDLGEQDERETSFVLRESGTIAAQPVEIVEVFYDDPKMAVNDLLRGELDVLDQLYPADAQRLALDKRIRIGSYALPTVHMLVPISDNAYLAKDKFRRALLYATNRNAMLTGELLNSTRTEDGRLISGPFPIGTGGADPLSYAYDPTIEPNGYNPQLAKLLVFMCQRELEEAAKKLKSEPPQLEKLMVACPDFEFARVAVQAMIQQWANVGIKAEMVVMPAGKSYDANIRCDLVYLTATLWEPATDIERLLGGKGVAATDIPFIVVALEKLRDARNWREVRDSLQDLHRLVDYHLPILPLWQVTDRFAYSRYVEGLENSPISLYENVRQWRINLDYLDTAAR